MARTGLGIYDPSQLLRCMWEDKMGLSTSSVHVDGQDHEDGLDNDECDGNGQSSGGMSRQMGEQNDEEYDQEEGREEGVRLKGALKNRMI